MLNPTDIARTVASTPWTAPGYGNHRVLVRVDAPAEVIRAIIPWHRRDTHPARIGLRVVRLDDGEEVGNLLPLRLTRECGEILFEARQAGRYAIYFLPYTIEGKAWYAPHVIYRSAEYPAADPAWAARARVGEWPEAVVEELQARTAMDRFDPMEVIAGAEETAALLARYPDAACLLFPDDRAHPIRMTDDLPAQWLATGPSTAYQVAAQPGEYLVFQLGVYAVAAMRELQVAFSALRTADGRTLPPTIMTCFNLGGLDWLGRPFTKVLDVPAGTVQPLWIGVDLPLDARGTFTGTVTVSAIGVPPQSVPLSLTVDGEVLPDRGDSELWKLSRLRWLNSTIGLDDEPAAGYPPVTIAGDAVACLGRSVAFGACGLPSHIRSYFAPSVDRLQAAPTEVLAAPIRLVATTARGPLTWESPPPRLEGPAPGAAVVTAEARTAGLSLQTTLRMEFDGHLDCRLTLTAAGACELSDLALEIPLAREVATYMMGLGRKGGYRPAAWDYAWRLDRSNHHCWLGTINAGLHLKLKHDADVWDLTDLQDSGFPAGWHNAGRGGVGLRETDEGVVLRAFTGPRTLATGETVSLRFSLIVTPLKPLDLPGHWRQRYHHIDCWNGRNPDLAEAKRVGATVVNLHQGGSLNPYINYPFHFSAAMRAETAAAHAAGLKYKLYYTVRELSHMAAELWAFRSLNGEIYREHGAAVIADQFEEREHRTDVSGGTGGPWLREHLVGRYVPAWQQFLPDGEMDQAIATTGLSRLHNHYLEGLGWLIRELGMDGLYLDGVGYDRQIMKRVRKTMDRARAGCLIDFHSGNNYHPDYGLNNVYSLYLELLPYVDSMWIGEGFDYNESPDYYLTEICGLPFGLTNDMLQGGGNPWRGMVYGMTCRYGWQQGGDPQHLWALWDAFGIAETEMYGYWHPECPVRTDHPDVLVTAYVKPDGTTLLALASWAPDAVACRLAIDWTRLGLAPATPLTAPAIPGFQDAADFSPAAAIPMAPGRGWLLTLGA
jgi:hypothetical protein